MPANSLLLPIAFSLHSPSTLIVLHVQSVCWRKVSETKRAIKVSMLSREALISDFYHNMGHSAVPNSFSILNGIDDLTWVVHMAWHILWLVFSCATVFVCYVFEIVLQLTSIVLSSVSLGSSLFHHISGALLLLSFCHISHVWRVTQHQQQWKEAQWAIR